MKIRGTFLKSKQTCYCFLCYFVFFSLKFHYFPYFELYFINELGRTINMYKIIPHMDYDFCMIMCKIKLKIWKKHCYNIQILLYLRWEQNIFWKCQKRALFTFLKKVLRFSWNCYGEFFRPIEIICENFSCQIAETFEKLHSPIFLSIDKRHCI